jgi:hypothetical protein
MRKLMHRDFITNQVDCLHSLLKIKSLVELKTFIDMQKNKNAHDSRSDLHLLTSALMLLMMKRNLCFLLAELRYISIGRH